jgi:vitamin B12 transporter
MLFFIFSQKAFLNYKNMTCYKTYSRFYSNRLICLWVCIIINSGVNAQKIDTTLHQLNEVYIIENKQQIIEASKKTSSIDSSTLARYNTSSLADLLSNQSTIHVKQYGNGNIASTSMRGGNSNHTALLWNGLNIQNALLGQPDLSIIPTNFFNDISLEYGGGSAMWGSGAIGGSIRLQNSTPYNHGFKTKLQMSIGSFNTKKINTGVLLSYKKIVSNTNIYFNNSKNNYNYRDTLDKETPNKQANHANYIAQGIMQEIGFLINAYQKINIRAWYNILDRNIPSFTNTESKQNQVDENLKLNADWNYKRRNLNSTIRFGYFNDNLNYVDSIESSVINIKTIIPKIISNSNIKTIIAESDNLYTYKKHSFNLGINFTNYQASLYSKELAVDTTYYYHLSKVAFFAAYKLSLLNSKLHYNLVIRKESTNQTDIPLTGNTGIYYKLLKGLALKINANKSYRQPSLYDLYWNPGGNKNLKPEESYEVDGGIELKYTKNNFNVLIEGTYFNRHTTNWIIWLPSDKSYWTPKNIAEVYSRGTETKTELFYLKNDFLIKLIANTSYVLSTNQVATSENDNSEGRQLIFTPRYNGQATLIIKYKNINVLFNYNYTGYRFTSTDNTSWVSPYYISNLKCSYDYSFSTINTQLFFSLNNLFNKNYVIIPNKPMPLRNYEIGISINYKQQKKKIETSNY